MSLISSTTIMLLTFVFVAPTFAGAAVGLPKTGQTECYHENGLLVPCQSTGQDGELQKGTVWPIPRFSENGDGTVTDSLTGLVWLKNANCFGLKTWNAALISANGLTTGICGLTDGSLGGQWRVPSIIELESIIDESSSNPALPLGHPFISVQNSFYWSSTTNANYTDFAWNVDLSLGYVGSYYIYKRTKGFSYYLWPVRSGK